MYQRAHDAGIRVVAGTIIPYNTATPDQNARMHDINDWIRTQGRADPGVIYVDTRAAAAAPADPDQLASSPDGLHPDAALTARWPTPSRPRSKALGSAPLETASYPDGVRGRASISFSLPPELPNSTSSCGSGRRLEGALFPLARPPPHAILSELFLPVSSS